MPFWADRGLDRTNGGYVEMFDAAGAASAPYKRTRVIGRQLYVFSHAAIQGWSGGAAAAEHGFRFLVDRARLPNGGWARRLSRSGQVIDARADLYDIAFVLFALGWYARFSGEAEPLRLAHQTLDRLDAEFRLPGGGFAHELPMTGPRLQNPHMHLLEAGLSLLEAAPGDERFRTLTDEIADLFDQRLYDRNSGTIAEYFDNDWRSAPGELGRTVEPGHQFEWAWILANHQRLTGRDHAATATGLAGFAEAHGVDPSTQVTFDAVRDDGQPLDRGSRTWPNTERIKGAIAIYELAGRDPRAALAGSAGLLLDRYLTPAGLWTDRFDEHGAPTIDTVPASTLYHVFLAFSELLRVAPALRL